MVTFYKIGESGNPTYPVLYLDTLKVSTIEQTGEEAEARGGKGNAALLIWDYNKEITVTLEDALFSAKSMAIMFGNGTVVPYTGEGSFIMKTEQFSTVNLTGSALPTNGKSDGGWDAYFSAPDGKRYTKLNPKFYDENGLEVVASNPKSGTQVEWATGKKYFCSYDLKVDGAVIEISANSFPGTYYVTGDTYARNQITGDDEFFQFIIPRAKVQSENTITLEAEGDPSVFNMNLRVMRPDDGVMMKLVKYGLTGTAYKPTTSDLSIVHNHYLIPEQSDKNANSTDVEPATMNLKTGTPVVTSPYSLSGDKD